MYMDSFWVNFYLAFDSNWRRACHVNAMLCLRLLFVVCGYVASSGWIGHLLSDGLSKSLSSGLFDLYVNPGYSFWALMVVTLVVSLYLALNGMWLSKCQRRTNLSDLLVALRAGDARDEDVGDVLAEVAWRRQVVGEVVEVVAHHSRRHLDVRLGAFLKRYQYQSIL